MITKQAIDEERLDELRATLSKIPGSARKPWLLEVYYQVDGCDRLAEVIDIRTGKPIKRRKELRRKRQVAPG